MPLVGDEYVKRDADDILSFLESEMRSEFGEDIDLTESSAFKTFAEAIAEVDSTDLESAIEEVYDSGYLDTAEGENLDKLVAILGVERRDAVKATGTVTFSHNGTVSQNHQIANGTTVQTNDTNPTQFVTTELVTMNLFDDFETGSLAGSYGGDTANFTVVDNTTVTPANGDFHVRSDAALAKIYKTAKVTEIGSKMDFRVHLPTNAGTVSAGQIFGLRDSDNYYRTVIDSDGNHKIQIVTQGTVEPDLASNTGLTIPADEYLRNQIIWSPENDGTITSQIYDNSGTLIDEIEVTDEARIKIGGFGFESLDANQQKYWDFSGDNAVTANIEAVEAGVVGNVGPNSITVMPTPPSGVDTLTNQFATGDDDHLLTDLNTYSLGRPEETDAQLRDRVKESEGERGSGTAPALLAALRGLEGANSVTIFENKTDVDNTGTGGLPPHSFEVVFFGTTDDKTIAETIFDNKGVTARDFNGVNGTATSDTVKAINNQTFTVNWSEPTKVDIDMTLDIVINDEYIGDDDLRDRIVEFIGGTLTDGSETIGLGVNEDVIINQLEDEIVGPSDTGVIGVDAGGTSYTPATTTDANGLEVIDIQASEVANTNGTDGSITINTTQI